MRRGEEIGRKSRNIKRNHVPLIEIKIGDKKEMENYESLRIMIHKIDRILYCEKI